jgi:hypothetical protein
MKVASFRSIPYEENLSCQLGAGLGWVGAASVSVIYPELHQNYRIAYGMAPTTPPLAEEQQ